MAENQCKLTDEYGLPKACCAVETLSCHFPAYKLLTDKGKIKRAPLRRLLNDEVGIEFDDDTLKKMLSPTPPQRGAVWRKSIDELFKGLNQLLEQSGESKIDLEKQPYYVEVESQNCTEEQAPTNISEEVSLITPSSSATAISSAAISSVDSNKVQLKEALLSLNYDEQSEVFQNSLKYKGPAIIFLIQGKSNGCPKWLVNRLAYSYRYEIGSNFNKPITPRRIETPIDEFWQVISHAISGTYTMVTPEQLIDYIYERWQTEPVMLIFKNLDRLAGKSHKIELINHFCKPLIKRAKSTLNNQHYLLIFLLENRVSNEAQSQYEENKDSNSNTDSLVALPFTQNFSLQDFEFWIRGNRGLPNIMSNCTSISERAQQLFEASDSGIPRKAMQKICESCGENWLAIEDTLAF